MAIVKAYPQLDEERVRLAAIYVEAYPAMAGRGGSERRPHTLKASERLAFDGLGRP